MCKLTFQWAIIKNEHNNSKMWKELNDINEFNNIAILHVLPPFDATKICPLQTQNLNPPSQVSSMIKFALQTIVPI